ncbi:MAG: hypothetical protein ABIO40_01975 [Devosia sp.]
MAWLERVAERQGATLAHRASEISSHQIAALQDQISDIARHLRASRHDLQSSGSEFAHAAGRFAGEAAQQFAGLARHEGSVAARIAAKQAVKAGRAIKADPMPAIVGLVGVALLVRLFSGHRPAAR